MKLKMMLKTRKKKKRNKKSKRIHKLMKNSKNKKFLRKTIDTAILFDFYYNWHKNYET